jgi:hypothetical protein
MIMKQRKGAVGLVLANGVVNEGLTTRILAIGAIASQYAPGPLNTAGIVFTKISKSNPRDH